MPISKALLGEGPSPIVFGPENSSALLTGTLTPCRQINVWKGGKRVRIGILRKNGKTMIDFDERVAMCALNRIFGFHPAVTHAITTTLGSALAVFGLDHESLSRTFGPFSGIAPRINDRELERSRAELIRLSGEGIRFVTFEDEDYPALLKECPDSPAGLYVRSSSIPSAIFNTVPTVAVVGTRDLSPYGREWCRKLVDALAGAGIRPAVVSGLAIGADITAHLASLDCGLPTIAVMATGIDDVYPSRHRAYASRIAASPGSALVTDYPPGTHPEAINFIRRNRIIAGMSMATVLIESKAHGGGLITARQAFNYDRMVFALPGRADDLRSAGCNGLIKEMIAEAVYEPEQFVKDLGLGVLTRRNRVVLEEEIAGEFGSCDPVVLEQLKRLANAVKSRRGAGLEELCVLCGFDFKTGIRLAGMLESAGIMEMDLLRRCSLIYKKM